MLATLRLKFQSDPNLTDNQLQDWCKKALAIPYESRIAQLKRDELLHYVTAEDIRNLRVISNRDYLYLKQLFVESQDKNMSKLQTPEETFGEKVSSEPCRKCGSVETITMAIQVRSADEPTSYYSQCESCSHRWRAS